MTRAIRLDPSDAEAYRGRGDVRLLQKRFSEAIADYRKSIELEPTDASMEWRGLPGQRISGRARFSAALGWPTT